MVFYPDLLPPRICSPTVIELRRDHEFFPQPRFDVGEWIADGLILGLRYDPLTREWSYWIETPELEPSTRWWPESVLEE